MSHNPDENPRLLLGLPRAVGYPQDGLELVSYYTLAHAACDGSWTGFAVFLRTPRATTHTGKKHRYVGFFGTVYDAPNSVPLCWGMLAGENLGSLQDRLHWLDDYKVVRGTIQSDLGWVVGRWLIPEMAPDDPVAGEPVDLTLVVSGQDRKRTALGGWTLRHLRDDALGAEGITQHDPNLWEVRDGEGHPLDLALPVAWTGLHEGDTLFITKKIGHGG